MIIGQNRGQGQCYKPFTYPTSDNEKSIILDKVYESRKCYFPMIAVAVRTKRGGGRVGRGKDTAYTHGFYMTILSNNRSRYELSQHRVHIRQNTQFHQYAHMPSRHQQSIYSFKNRGEADSITRLTRRYLKVYTPG
jgi:hypothetical protein